MESNSYRILKPFKEGLKLLKNPQMQPEHTISYSIREQVKGVGFYTNSEERRQRRKQIWHYNLFFQITLNLVTLIYGAWESLDNIVSLGLDITFSTSAFFILFRMVFFVLRADQMDEVVEALEKCYRCERKGPGWKDVRATKRWNFLAYVILAIIWLTAVIPFILITISTPFWIASQTLPFHVAYPFQLQDPTKHPITHSIIFASQAITVGYLMSWLVFAEALCMFIFIDLACTLTVLSIELRNLHEFCDGDEVLLAREVKRLTRAHQQIILISERLNDIFNGPLIIQLMVNFVQISLSVFETLAFRDNPKVAIAYLMVMIMALGHLSCWSKIGDILSEESLDVSVAAYEAYNPSLGSRSIHRHLGFIMQRAQEPLIMRARPFANFNLRNYMAVLKQCYTILTLLMQTLE